MTTEQQVRDAAEMEDTICTACGSTGGEAKYECFLCGKTTVLPARLVLEVLNNVEREEEE